MNSFPLFFATSGRTKRREHNFCLLFHQYWTWVQTKINDLLTSPKNQFRDYFIRNRIEKLMPQLWNFPPQTLKTSKPTNPFSNLDFWPKSGFPKTRDLSPGVIHDFWKIDVIDACLMVHGPWLKAHGSWPREARGGSWPDACPALGTQSRAGPDPDRERGSGSLGHEP